MIDRILLLTAGTGNLFVGRLPRDEIVELLEKKNFEPHRNIGHRRGHIGFKSCKRTRPDWRT